MLLPCLIFRVYLRHLKRSDSRLQLQFGVSIAFEQHTHLAQFSIVNELWTVSMNERAEPQTIFPAERTRQRKSDQEKWQEFNFKLVQSRPSPSVCPP